MGYDETIVFGALIYMRTDYKIPYEQSMDKFYQSIMERLSPDEQNYLKDEYENIWDGRYWKTDVFAKILNKIVVKRFNLSEQRNSWGSKIEYITSPYHGSDSFLAIGVPIVGLGSKELLSTTLNSEKHIRQILDYLGYEDKRIAITTSG